MSEITFCSHCHSQVFTPYLGENSDDVFCCHGCKLAFEIIHSCGLEHYYQLKKMSEDKSDPIKNAEASFDYLDKVEFQEAYVLKEEKIKTMKFYLEGIHCVACLWIIEKMPDLFHEIKECRLDMSKSILYLGIKSDAKFSTILERINQFGYKPHPLKSNDKTIEKRIKEDRSYLIKIAVAFAGMGNIMLLSFSIYAGAYGEFLKQFHFYSFILALPVLLYSAQPFYKSALGAIRSKSISIDIPIVLAILLGTFMSLFNIYYGSNHIYFDSLTSLIFLLLSARYLLKKSYNKALNTSEIAELFTNSLITRLNKESLLKESVHSSTLAIGDTIYLKEDEFLPVDAKLLSEEASIETSLLTGESLPISIKKGEIITSGSVSLENEIKIEVLRNFSQSRLGKILEKVEAGWNTRPKIVTLTDKISKYFVISVIVLAIGTFFYTFIHTNSFYEAFNRSLALIIVTCPCALGLATPLALSLSLGKLSKNGMIIKNEHSLEKLNDIKTIFLDKTGTLTYGHFKLSSYKATQDFDEKIAIILTYQLEKNNQHPIAKSLIRDLIQLYPNLREENLIIKNKKIIPSKGVTATWIENKVEIKGIDSNSPLKLIGLFVNNKLVFEFELKDTIRESAFEFIQYLQNKNIEPILLSGDNKTIVKDIASKLQIKKYYANTTPEEKSEILKKHPNSAMIGDGANDAIALSHASVGIAVKGSMELSLKACEVYITKEGLQPLKKLLDSSYGVLKLIKINLFFSLLYNTIGAILAMSGAVSPLMAAVLMPLSSFTVILITIVYGLKLNTTLR